MTIEPIQRLRDAVLCQITAPESERTQARTAVHEAAMACSSDSAERIDLLADAQDWALQRAAEINRAASTVHIRKKAGPSLGNQFYSHSHRAQFVAGYRDPQADTLCGADPTSYDMSWAETRYQKSRSYVQCGRCIKIRIADPQALR